MRVPVIFLTLCLSQVWAWHALAGGDRFQTLYQCPFAEIMCLEKVGYNYQICGTLTGIDNVTQEFPQCPASDRAASAYLATSAAAGCSTCSCASETAVG